MVTNKFFESRVSFVLLLVMLMLHSSLQAQLTWQSNLVQLDSITGVISYSEDPVSNIRIPDFSRAGYKGGESPIPNVTVQLTIAPINGDNTLHIQNAIDSVSSLVLNADGLRGTVLLSPGVYRVYGTLTITASGVVLRGAGNDMDTLNNTHILGMGNSPSDRVIIHMGGLSNTKFSGQVSGTQTNIVSPVVHVGDKKFRVADPSSFQAGDNIIISHPCTPEWLMAVDGGGTGNDPSWTVNSQPILYNTRINSIKCDTIITNSPVFNRLEMGISQAFIYKYDRAGLLENIGVENLRIDIQYDTLDVTDDDHAKSAIKITQAENSWIRDCVFLHFWYAGVNMETANYITVDNCKALTPIGPTAGGKKYNFCLSQASQNVLFTNCVASEGRHNFISNGTSSVAGVVFHNCVSLDPLTSSEGHRRWSTGLLFDKFVDSGNNPGRVLALYNRGSWGTGHGWSAANSVAWNCDATRPGTDGQILVQRPPTAQNFAIGCKGVVNGIGPYNHPVGYIEGANLMDSLIPSSLYEAQLHSRHYQDSIENLTATDFHVACDSFVWIDGNTYTSSNNTATWTLTNVQGCDSIVTLNLTINSLSDISTTVDSFMITANNSNATYQWLDCNNNFAILPGETGQTFMATSNGKYSVELNENGCIDTSSCIPIMFLGTIENSFSKEPMVFPNPSNGKFYVQLDAVYQSAEISIMTINGHSVFSKVIRNQDFLCIDAEIPPGTYLMTIVTEEQRAVSRIIMN